MVRSDRGKGQDQENQRGGDPAVNPEREKRESHFGPSRIGHRNRQVNSVQPQAYQHARKGGADGAGTRRGVAHAWQKALKRACIETFRWHDIRPTLGPRHRQSGTPTHEPLRLGSWRTSVMVERYAHLAPDHLAKAANRLDSILGGHDLATLEKEKGVSKQR
jgi:hypothetical protein